MRKEKDFLGERELPVDALYGIHALRATGNFPGDERFPEVWYRATGKVKRACYQTIIRYREAMENEHPGLLQKMRLPGMDVLKALVTAAGEVAAGEHFDHFIVPAMQGGAGTSINMNINEIIANRALQLTDRKPGDYQNIDPVEDANLFQSTNDVIPTALTVAAMELLNHLEASVNATRQETEQLEKRYRNTIRIAFTQMQEAVPGTYGQLFSTYSDALSRDWWRISKAKERIKLVNLGGGATGTGLALPRFYIMEVTGELRKETGLPLAQAENLSDATANLDSLAEVHAILKSHAVNMEKIADDLRLLSAGISGEREIMLPKRQAGSSIMPGKVNPVIPEYLVSVAHQVYSNDQLITTLTARGSLDLNAYLPLIGITLIRSLKLMTGANQTLKSNLLEGLKVNEELAASRLYRSPSVSTILSPLIGYHRATELACHMQDHNVDIFRANEALNILSKSKLNEILSARYLLKKGFTAADLDAINREEP